MGLRHFIFMCYDRQTAEVILKYAGGDLNENER